MSDCVPTRTLLDEFRLNLVLGVYNANVVIALDLFILSDSFIHNTVQKHSV
jgi:hypothetical protein